MPMDRSDWEELQDRRLKAKVTAAPQEGNSEKSVARMLAGKLGSSKEWNKLTEYVARNVLKCDGIIQAYQEVLLSPERVNQEDIVKAKIGYHAHLAARDAYQDILNYPEKFKKVEE
tara:strand:- start:10607 stop:10954 length:348 start_codon:yes stop_codon:yes gene_type:complete